MRQKRGQHKWESEGMGTVSQRESGSEGDLKGKAIWVMGRAIPESNGEGEGNGQS